MTAARRRGAAFAAGGAIVAALVAGALAGDARAVFGAFAAAWLYAAGLAAGVVAVSASLQLARGRSTEDVFAIADAASSFFVPAACMLAVLLVAAPLWMPRATSGALAALVVRDLAATLALFAAGRRYLSRSRSDGGPAAATVYLLLYAVTLSLWAIDLVMALGRGAPSTIVPPYFFFGAYLGGFAWLTLVAALRERGPSRHDLGKLMLGLTSFWAYLLWSAFFPVWYGNLPDETAQLLARWHGPWRSVTLAVVGGVFVVPFVLLLPERTKRSRAVLVIASGLVLSGLLAEHFLLVMPSLSLRADAASFVVGTIVCLGVLAMYAVTVVRRAAH